MTKPRSTTSDEPGISVSSAGDQSAGAAFGGGDAAAPWRAPPSSSVSRLGQQRGAKTSDDPEILQCAATISAPAISPATMSSAITPRPPGSFSSAQIPARASRCRTGGTAGRPARMPAADAWRRSPTKCPRRPAIAPPVRRSRIRTDPRGRSRAHDRRRPRCRSASTIRLAHDHGHAAAAVQRDQDGQRHGDGAHDGARGDGEIADAEHRGDDGGEVSWQLFMAVAQWRWPARRGLRAGRYSPCLRWWWLSR